MLVTGERGKAMRLPANTQLRWGTAGQEHSGSRLPDSRKECLQRGESKTTREEKIVVWGAHKPQ